MINNSTVNSIAPLVGTFDSSPLSLVPVAESILSVLCTASNPQLANSFNGEVGFQEEWLESIRNSAVYGTRDPIAIHDGENGVSQYFPAELHDKTMEEAANVVSDAAVRGINYTKTVVKPAVNNFLEHLDANLEVKGAIKNPFNIIPIVPSEAWTSRVIELALEPLTKTGKAVIVTRNRIPKVVFDAETLNGYSSGNKKLDTALDTILKQKDLTRDILAKQIFGGQGDIGSYSIYDRRDGDLYLAKFILVNTLADNPPSVNMALKDWQLLMLSLSQAFGSLCGHHQRVMDGFRDSKNIVLDASFSDNNIFVDSTNYDKWLTTGGTPEILMGGMIVRRSNNQTPVLSTVDLDKNAATYTLAMNRFKSSEQHAELSRRELRVREALRGALVATLADIDVDTLREDTDLNAVTRNGVAYISKLKAYQLEDFGKLGTELVCKLIFPHSNALVIIESMSKYIDSGMSATEAEQLTVMDYISDWVLDGIRVG